MQAEVWQGLGQVHGYSQVQTDPVLVLKDGDYAGV